MEEMITSRANPLVKETAKLVASGRERRKSGRFVLEGARLCFDILHSTVEVDTLFYTAEVAARYQRETAALTERAGRAYEITPEVAAKLKDTTSSQGVFCVCRIPLRTTAGIVSTGKYIALEGLQDPANLGAACRTAEALGLSGAIVAGCCDVYSPKALRSSMGSLLRLPLLFTDSLPDLLARGKEAGMEVLASVPDADAQSILEAPLSGGVITLIGNEGAGLSEQAQRLATRRVTIPMLGRAESLNASMAAAILMWEMMRGETK